MERSQKVYETAHRRISGCIVNLVSSVEVGVEPNKEHSYITGTAIYSRRNLCCIMALKKGLFPDNEPDVYYNVHFPNKASLKLTKSDVHFVDLGEVAIFAFKTPSKYVDEVKLCHEEVKQNQLVYLAGFKGPSSVPCHVAPCFVSSLDKHNKHFCYGSSKFLYTAYGEPVFNTIGDLVGLSFKDSGVIYAMTIPAILEHLSKFLPGEASRDEIVPNIIKIFQDAPRAEASPRGAGSGDAA